jgi:hypothetical protein
VGKQAFSLDEELHGEHARACNHVFDDLNAYEDLVNLLQSNLTRKSSPPLNCSTNVLTLGFEQMKNNKGKVKKQGDWFRSGFREIAPRKIGV